MNWYLPSSLKLTPGQKSLMSFTIFRMQILVRVGTGNAINFLNGKFERSAIIERLCFEFACLKFKVHWAGPFVNLENVISFL